MRSLEWIGITAVSLLLVIATPHLASAQQTDGAADVQLTLDVALEPDEAILLEAIRMAPAHAEEFVELADQIAAVEPVDVGAISRDNAAVERALNDAEAALPLLRTLLQETEIVAAALEQADLSVEDVIAAPVIYEDVVSVVLYYQQ